MKYYCEKCGSKMSLEDDDLICYECGWNEPVHLYRTSDNERNDWEYNFFDDDEDDEIPIGCEACGGPWPFCTSSCLLFDD